LDPDEYLLKYGKEKFDKFIEEKSQNVIEFVFERIFSNTDKTSPQAKAKAVSNILSFIVKTKNVIVQREYIKYVARKLAVEEEILLRELNKNSLKNNRIYINKTEDKKIKETDSLEEDMLKFLLQEGNRAFIKKLDNNFFTIKNCSDIYNLLSADNNLSVAEIIAKLDGKQAEWFSKIAMDGSFDNLDVDETFDTLYKDISLAKLEKERKLIEKEVLLMLDGKIEADDEKINRYNKLTAQIKGSGKSK